jgi:hypothetical protein
MSSFFFGSSRRIFLFGCLSLKMVLFKLLGNNSTQPVCRAVSMDRRIACLWPARRAFRSWGSFAGGHSSGTPFWIGVIDYAWTFRLYREALTFRSVKPGTLQQRRSAFGFLASDFYRFPRDGANRFSKINQGALGCQVPTMVRTR